MIRKAQEEAKKKPAPISGASPGDPDFEKKESLARKAKELESKNLAEVRREKEVKEKNLQIMLKLLSKQLKNMFLIVQLPMFQEMLKTLNPNLHNIILNLHV